MFDVITIGTATRDVFLTSPLFRIVRDPEHLKKIGFPTGEAQCFALGGKIEIGKPISITGGGAGNAAVTFSRQGFKTAALIKIDNDEAAESILKELSREKVNPIPVRKSRKGTAYSTILLAPGGERTILVYRGASEDLKSEEIPFQKLNSRWVYIAPGKISLPVAEKIFNHFAKNKTLIAFSPSGHFIKMGIKKLKPLLTKTKVFILNREEASFFTGIDYRKEKEIFRKLDKIVSGIAAMTDGQKGSLISDGFNIYQAETFKTKNIIDETGAGDAFGSGFVAGLIHMQEACEKGLCRTDNIKYAIRLASANAASVVKYIGAKEGILTKKEFNKNKRWKKLKININK